MGTLDIVYKHRNGKPQLGDEGMALATEFATATLIAKHQEEYSKILLEKQTALLNLAVDCTSIEYMKGG